MALDDDQGNWNKENIPLNKNKAVCWEVSQNATQEIKQEVTRQVLAELTIGNSDESDESDGREDNDGQQHLAIHQTSFSSQQNDDFCDFQNGEANTNGPKQKQTGIITEHQCSAHNSSRGESEKCFCFGVDWACSGKISIHSVQRKWKPLERWKPSETSTDLSENKGRTAISGSSENEKKAYEGLEEFVTPPLCTIPGFELEHKLEGCGPTSLSETVSPKTSTS